LLLLEQKEHRLLETWQIVLQRNLMVAHFVLQQPNPKFQDQPAGSVSKINYIAISSKKSSSKAESRRTRQKLLQSAYCGDRRWFCFKTAFESRCRP